MLNSSRIEQAFHLKIRQSDHTKLSLRSGLFGSKFRHALSGYHQSIPVLQHVIWRSAFARNDLSHLICRIHADGVPWTNRQFVWVRFLSGNGNAHITTDTAFNINLTPRLQYRNGFACPLEAAIKRLDLEAGFTSGTVIRIDNCNFLRQFFPRTRFGHESVPCKDPSNCLAT